MDRSRPTSVLRSIGLNSRAPEAGVIQPQTVLLSSRGLRVVSIKNEALKTVQLLLKA